MGQICMQINKVKTRISPSEVLKYWLGIRDCTQYLYVEISSRDLQRVVQIRTFSNRKWLTEKKKEIEKFINKM